MCSLPFKMSHSKLGKQCDSPAKDLVKPLALSLWTVSSYKEKISVSFPAVKTLNQTEFYVWIHELQNGLSNSLFILKWWIANKENM